jgi:hypothetical protein
MSLNALKYRSSKSTLSIMLYFTLQNDKINIMTPSSETFAQKLNEHTQFLKEKKEEMQLLKEKIEKAQQRGDYIEAERLADELREILRHTDESESNFLAIHGQELEELQEHLAKKEIEKNSQKVTHFTGEEFIRIGEIAKSFWQNCPSEHPPKFVIMMGGVGSGKTTVRRQRYSSGYVNFDYTEIMIAVEKAVGKDEPRLESYVSLANSIILQECIVDKKNIVIEITGDNKEILDPVLDGMKKLGYDISIEFIHCDPVEAYKRHLKAVEEDKDYVSAYFTQEATLSFFYQRLGLGPMPAAPKVI